MKVLIKGTGSEVSLTQNDFVAQGGQAKIFTRNGVAFKVYHDPKDALPEGKIAELGVIADQRVVRPENVLVDQKGTPIGYTTKFIRDAYVLCQLFPKVFKDREHLTHDMVLELTLKMQETLANIHKAGALVVDLNEMNFLVPHGFKEIYFIDVDSYQTAHYRAPALMESVRDWTVQNHAWTPNSDWYSFAVVTFQLFTGIHPFKGQYSGAKQELKTKIPTDGPDDQFAVTRRRMQQHVSVFSSEVKVPGCVYPVTVIPSEYRSWYEQIFSSSRRSAPPNTAGTAVAYIPVTVTTGGSTKLEMTELGVFDGEITGVWVDGSTTVVATKNGLWVNNARQPINLSAELGVGFSMKSGRVAAIGRKADAATVANVTDRVTVATTLPSAVAVGSYGKRLYLQSTNTVYEVELVDMGTQLTLALKPAVNILPHATKLFNGVVVQNMIGSIFVSLLAGAGYAPQIRIPELNNYTIIDAKYDSYVLMVIGAKRDGTYDRLVFRFNNMGEYDVRVVKNITPSGLNFVTLDTGICVLLNEDEQLELFKAEKDHRAIKIVEDRLVTADLRLWRTSSSVLCSRGNKLYKLALK